MCWWGILPTLETSQLRKIVLCEKYTPRWAWDNSIISNDYVGGMQGVCHVFFFFFFFFWKGVHFLTLWFQVRKLIALFSGYIQPIFIKQRTSHIGIWALFRNIERIRILHAVFANIRSKCNFRDGNVWSAHTYICSNVCKYVLHAWFKQFVCLWQVLIFAYAMHFVIWKLRGQCPYLESSVQKSVHLSKKKQQQQKKKQHLT